jgi:hypothetical protein
MLRDGAFFCHTVFMHTHLRASRPFHSIYTHGFIRAAVGVPFVRVADPAHNAARTIELARRASENHAAVALFLN